MTLGQALLGLMFLLNMEFAWWEAAGLFGLWLVQFIFSVGFDRDSSALVGDLCVLRVGRGRGSTGA